MFVSRLLRLAFLRRRVVLLLACALAAVTLPFLSNLKFDSNVLNLLPQRGPAIAAFRAFLERFGSLDHVYVVFDAPEGHDVSEYAAVINSYLDALRHAPEIARVDAGLFQADRDWSYLAERQLVLLGPEGARDTLKRFEPAAMDHALAESRSLLAVPAPEIRQLIQQDPLGLLGALRERLAGEGSTLAVDPRQEGYTTVDGRSRLVIARPTQAPFDTDFCRRLLERLQAIGAKALEDLPEDDEGRPLPAPSISVAGAYRNALEVESLIRNEGVMNAVGSMLLIILVLLVVFRSHWLVWCSAVPITLAALVTLAVNGLFYRVSSAASGGAAMLFGLSIDAVALLYVRYLQERRNGFEPLDAIERTADSAVSATLAVVTTAATYLALLWIDFPSLQELGRLVGAGILLCGAFTLLLVPALLPRRDPRVAPWVIAAPWLPAFVARYRGPIIALGVITTVALTVPAFRTRIVASLERLEPDTPALVLERDIAERFGIPRETVLAVKTGADLDDLLDAHAQFERRLREDLPGLRVHSPTGLLPPESAQEQVDRVLTTIAADVPSMASRFSDAAVRAGFRPGVFAEFIDRLPRMLAPSQRITLDELHAHGLGDLVGRFVARHDQTYSAVSYIYPRSRDEIAAVQRVVAGLPGMQLTGVPLVNDELQDAFLPQFSAAMTGGTLAVGLLVYLGFRRIRDTLLALAVTAVGIIWGLGMLALAGIDLDMFSIFGVLMCIGIGSDYALHILHRRHSGGDLVHTLTHVAPPIMMAASTTLIGFATLIPSSYPPLASLGLVASVTALCCAVVSLVVLPAALMGQVRP